MTQDLMTSTTISQSFIPIGQGTSFWMSSLGPRSGLTGCFLGGSCAYKNRCPSIEWRDAIL
jgi:hypothetical protein